MNHQLWTAVGSRVLALTFVMAGVVACGDGLDRDASARAPKNETSPSAVVIGQAPAEPTPAPAVADTPQVTSPAGAQGEVSKQADSTQRPLEGDNHSYSTLSPVTPQKAEGVSGTEERKPQ